MELLFFAIVAAAALGIGLLFAWLCASTKLPQFTIRDLLLSTTLIAAGVGALAAAFRLPVFEHQLAFFILYLSSGPFMGAGVFLPFGRTRLGFVLGCLLALVMCCLLPAVVVRE
jgi:hypothetical protein